MCECRHKSIQRRIRCLHPQQASQKQIPLNLPRVTFPASGIKSWLLRTVLVVVTLLSISTISDLGDMLVMMDKKWKLEKQEASKKIRQESKRKTRLFVGEGCFDAWQLSKLWQHEEQKRERERGSSLFQIENKKPSDEKVLPDAAIWQRHKILVRSTHNLSLSKHLCGRKGQMWYK